MKRNLKWEEQVTWLPLSRVPNWIWSISLKLLCEFALLVLIFFHMTISAAFQSFSFEYYMFQYLARPLLITGSSFLHSRVESAESLGVSEEKRPIVVLARWVQLSRCSPQARGCLVLLQVTIPDRSFTFLIQEWSNDLLLETSGERSKTQRSYHVPKSIVIS